MSTSGSSPHHPAAGDEQAAHDAAILRDLHARHFGDGDVACTALRGDGSARRIHRLTGAHTRSIGIASADVRQNRAFIGFSRAFHAAGLSVPRILAVSHDEQHYLEDDLGDVTLHAWMQKRRDGAYFTAEVRDMYVRVLHELVRFQVDAADAVDYGLCHQWDEFGAEAMRFDTTYFRGMFLDQLLPGGYDGAAFEQGAAVLIDRCLQEDRRHFLYRDFQSRNVMILDGRPWFIDYQSGRRGAPAYDAASMLFDARAAIPPAERSMLLEAYLDALRSRPGVDVDRVRGSFPAFALLRVLQALGAFGNLGLRQGKVSFLEGIEPGLVNLRHLVTETGALDGNPTLRACLTGVTDPASTRHITEQLRRLP